MNSITIPRFHYLILGMILICSGYLMLKNLGSTTLWDDEAQTAIIAQNYLKTGHLTGWDGRNLYWYRNGTVLNKDLNIINPPLQFLAAALSFKVLGSSTFAARLPFALFGLLTIVLLYVVIRRELPHLPSMALYAAAFLGICAEYILYARNCRYYALVMLFAVLTFYWYRRFVEKSGWLITAGLAVSIVSMFYAHFQMAAAFVLALAVMFAVFDRKKLSPRHWQMLLAAGILCFLAIVPYSFYFRLWNRPDMQMHIDFMHRAPLLLWVYGKAAILTGFAPWGILALTGAGLWIGKFDAAKKSFIARVLFLLSVNIIVVALTSQQDFTDYHIAQLRYLVVCFPFTAILAAGICHWIEGKVRWLALLALLAIAGTNCASYLGGSINQFSPVLYNYINEINHPYPTAYESVSRYLKEHAHPGETMYAAPEYMSYPLQFYIGDFLYNACVADTTSWLGASRLRDLSPRLLKEDNFPDWFIAFGNHSGSRPAFRLFCRELRDTAGAVYNHAYAADTVLPVFWDQTHRPEIVLHFWRNKQPASSAERVTLYRKLPDGQQVWLSNFQKIIDADVTFSDTMLLMTELKKLSSVFSRDPGLVYKNIAPNRIRDFFKIYEKMLADRGDYAQAEQVLNTIIKIEPGNSLNYGAYAQLMLAQRKYDRVIELCNNIIALTPAFPFSYYMKAQALAAMKKNNSAAETLRRGIAAVKDNARKQQLQASLDNLLQSK